MGVWKNRIHQDTSSPEPRSPEPGPLKPETPEMSRMETFVVEPPMRNMDELIVPLNVRKQLEAAMNRIRYHEVLYEDWNLKKIDPCGRRVAVNLYG
ncbi:MAG: hypothetical protein AB7S77_00970, partial [Desulfatirhabdiaceae bacterium]